MNQEQLVAAIVAEVKRVLELRGISVNSGDSNVKPVTYSAPKKTSLPGTLNTGSPAPASKKTIPAASGETLDLTGIKVITRKSLEGISAGQVLIAQRAVVTPMASDYAREKGIAFVRNGDGQQGSYAGNTGAALPVAAVAVDPAFNCGNRDIAGLFARQGVNADLIAGSSYEAAVTRCAENVASGGAQFAVCIERTGFAGPVYANRNPRIRAAFCRNMNDVRAARRDLDANVIVLDSLSILPSVLNEMAK